MAKRHLFSLVKLRGLCPSGDKYQVTSGDTGSEQGKLSHKRKSSVVSQIRRLLDYGGHNLILSPKGVSLLLMTRV